MQRSADRANPDQVSSQVFGGSATAGRAHIMNHGTKFQTLALVADVQYVGGKDIRAELFVVLNRQSYPTGRVVERAVGGAQEALARQVAEILDPRHEK